MKNVFGRLLVKRALAVLGKSWFCRKDESLKYFLYDKNRFLHYSGACTPITCGKLTAKLIKEYHVVEKCLTMPGFESGHGLTAVQNLFRSVRLYLEKGFNVKDGQFVHAIGVLKAYLRQQPRIVDDEINKFCSRWTDIPPANQLKYSREEFFRNINDPFPVFARSRHTVRNFSDRPIDVEKLKKAVACATFAPSACNRQYVRAHIILNKSLIRRILDIQGGSRGFGHLATGLIIVTVDLEGVGSVREHNDVYTNGGMFMMALCYAMHYYEIAHCILNWSKSPEDDISIRKIHNIPSQETIVAIIACGEAKDEFYVAASPRKPASEIMCIYQ